MTLNVSPETSWLQSTGGTPAGVSAYLDLRMDQGLAGTAPMPVQGSAQGRTGTLVPPEHGGGIWPDENTVMGLSREGKGPVKVRVYPGTLSLVQRTCLLSLL